MTNTELLEEGISSLKRARMTWSSGCIPEHLYGFTVRFEDAQAILTELVAQAARIRELESAALASDAQIAELQKALEWYACEAEACARNSGRRDGESLLASLTVLSLDGGRRALDAIKNADQLTTTRGTAAERE